MAVSDPNRETEGSHIYINKNPDLHTARVVKSLSLLTGWLLLVFVLSGTRIDFPPSLSIWGLRLKLEAPYFLALAILLGLILFLTLWYTHYFFFRHNSPWRIQRGLLSRTHPFYFSYTQPTESPQPPLTEIFEFVHQFFPGISDKDIYVSRPLELHVERDYIPPSSTKPREFHCLIGVSGDWVLRKMSVLRFQALPLKIPIPTWSLSLSIWDLWFPIWLNAVAATLLIVSLTKPNIIWAQRDNFFASNPDVLWEEAIKTVSCPHVEGVPIVAKDPTVTARAVALSTIVGYFNLSFPIIGPATPSRIPRLVDQVILRKGELTRQRGEVPRQNTELESAKRQLGNTLDGKGEGPTQKELLFTRLYDLEDQTFREFLQYARQRPYEAEGLIRAYALEESYNGKPEAALQTLASAKYQIAKLKSVHPSRDAVAQLIRSKSIGLLSLDGGAVLYPVLGGLHDGEFVTVIDPSDAVSITTPAMETLLSPRDLQSNGEFAKHARAYLQGKVLKTDMIVPCSGPRPSGIRFIQVDKLPAEAELSVIESWELDVSRLLSYRSQETRRSLTKGPTTKASP